MCFLAIDYSVRQSAKLSKPAAKMASIIAPHLARSFQVSHRLASVHHGPAQDTAARLHVAFRLTPAEAKLAVALIGGLSLDGYARDRGIAVTTARNQLQSLFEKTRTHRQGELVAALFSELRHPARF